MSKEQLLELLRTGSFFNDIDSDIGLTAKIIGMNQYDVKSAVIDYIKTINKKECKRLDETDYSQFEKIEQTEENQKD